MSSLTGPATVTLLALLFLAGVPACKPMLYPAARAFGSPSEGELKKCRTAFIRLKDARATARIVVYAAIDPVGTRKDPFAGTAELLAEQLKEKGWTHCSCASGVPSVQPTPLLRNQLRYTWSRAHLYGRWVETTRPEGDFFLFLEVLAPPANGIIGIQCYVVDASGQVAYARLMNSHHFGGTTPKDPETACRLILRAFLRDLERRAEEVFPPYGVG